MKKETKQGKAKNIGIDVKAPKDTCNDKNCPFHGTAKLRGRSFTGVVIGLDLNKTARVEWTRNVKLPKYERFEIRKSRVKAHNPECIAAKKGDTVRIMECKPLSKIKTFIIIEKLEKQNASN